jgi:hypothetical protein
MVHDHLLMIGRGKAVKMPHHNTSYPGLEALEGKIQDMPCIHTNHPVGRVCGLACIQYAEGGTGG